MPEREKDVWQICIARGVKLSANYELAAKLDEEEVKKIDDEFQSSTDFDLVEMLDSESHGELLRRGLRLRDNLNSYRNEWAREWIEDNQDKVQQYRKDQAESLASDNAERDQDARREW
jgi:hypothetical protein